MWVTGYNSELSDRPFNEKRDMKGGFKDSPIRLNQGLRNLEHWNREQIEKRAEHLATIATQIWPYPQIASEVLSKHERPKNMQSGTVYTLDDHPYTQRDVKHLFDPLRRQVLNLDSSVREEVKKLYIAYKSTTNFVDVVPQKSALRLSINVPFDKVKDPKGLCKDVSNVGRWGNGDVEVRLSSLEQMDDVMDIIRQGFEYQSEDGNEVIL